MQKLGGFEIFFARFLNVFYFFSKIDWLKNLMVYLVVYGVEFF